MDRIQNHWGLLILLAVYLCVAATYSLVLPLGEAADETDHFALVRFIAEHKRPPLTLEERRLVGPKGDASPIYHGLVALLTQHVDVSALPDLPHTQQRPERFIPSDGFRANLIFHTEDEAFPFHDIVLAWHLARLVSIPLGAATVIAAYLTVLTIYLERRYSPAGTYWLALAVAGFVAFLPRFVTSSAVVNDDNLVVPLVAFSVYCLMHVVQGNEQRRTFVMLGVLMGLAAITKYHSLILLPEMTIVLIVLAWQKHWGWRALLRRWGWCMLAFMLSSGWWFAFLIIQFNQVSGLGWVRGLMAPLGDPVVTLGFGRLLDFRPGSALVSEFGWSDWADLLFRTFWIVYGWLHVFATPTVYQILGLFTLVAVLGLARYGWTCLSFRRSGSTYRGEIWQPGAALLAFHFLVYLGVVIIRYLLRPDPETAQGRHLYPALTSIAFFFVLGLNEALQTLRWLPDSLLQGSKPGEWSRPGSSERTYRFDKTLAIGIGGTLIALSVLTPPFFILPVYLPYLPIVTADPSQVPISHRLEASFAPGLDFEGYDLERSQIETGEVLPVTLYWYAGARQERDYLVKICLRDDAGEVAICRQGHPVDGRYPVRAWEVGYLIRDELYLPTPYCLPPGNYELTLSVLPLRLDTASTAVDETAKIEESLSLGQITLSVGQQMPSEDFDLWVGKERHNRGEIELKQIRQSLTFISYWPAERPQSDDTNNVHLLSASADPISNITWSPIASGLTYHCPDGPTISTHNFVVDPGVKPARYYLKIGDQAKTEPLVTVITRPRDFSPPASIPVELSTSFAGEVKLLGYEADLSSRWPGDTIQVTAYWQSLRTMSRHDIVTLHLLDNAMNTGGQSDQILGGHYPNVLWAPGEIVHEVYPLPINHQTPAGLYTIEFSVYYYVSGTFYFLPATTAANQEPVEHLYLGRVRVMDPARTRPPSHPMMVELGSQIQLLGYDLSFERLAVNEPLHLTLHWQAISQPKRDYTIFTQLISPDGLVWGQQDNQPQGGRYPTTAWIVQDRVVDRYKLTLREGAPPSQYRLLVGMYDLATGQRLTAIGEDGTRLPDDAILLTTLTVK